MNGEDFVRKLHDAVVVSAAEESLAARAAPPGRRKKSDAELELAQWIGNLDEVSQRNVQFLMKTVADSTLFAMLCILDGVRGIDSGDLELWHVENADQRRLLNGPKEEMLNSIYRGLYPPLMP